MALIDNRTDLTALRDELGPDVYKSLAALLPMTNAGAPTVNVTGLGAAQVGTLLVDTTNGKLYICTATNGTSTITWAVVGSQT